MALLLRLTIDGVGLIEHAEVDFADGFSAFTGETGSGKTMLLGAIELALGGRVEREIVRGERARVVLEIAPSEQLRAHLTTAGIELAPDDDIVIVREIAATGRSQARINGIAVSASQLRELGSLVVDTVGQGEAQRLLEPAFAREVIDRFGGPEVFGLAATVRERYDERRRVSAEHAALQAGGERALAERESAQFALAEIDAVTPLDGEDERLRERRDVLSNAERIADALASARSALEDERGAVDTLGDAAHALGALARFGTVFAPLAESAAALQSEANALAAGLARAADDVELDPQELEAVSERLAAIEALKKKHGGSIAAICAARERFAAAVDADLGRDGRLTRLAREIAALDAALAADADALHDRRVAAAIECERRVADELRALAMPAARFTVAIDPLDVLGPHGRDRLEFRFSANPGEPERGLAKIASGGERSRVLLAIVVVLADRNDARAFVFDEIDAGVGGATAAAVGARLGRLARVAQVICVTHLAQIASWADAHYTLRKDDDGGMTTIAVVSLDTPDHRLREIARMLSGEATPISLEHAAELVAASRPGGAPGA